MKQDELRRLARMGAAARLAELERERAALLRDFPGLRTTSGTAAVQRDGRSRKRRVMSAANRRAVSIRMKKYWAARRKAKAAKA
jgi:hypothetical protein